MGHGQAAAPQQQATGAVAVTEVAERYVYLLETAYDNGKLCSFSHRAFRLWAMSLSYARKHRTDGALSAQQAAVLLRLYGLTQKDADELVEKGGWERAEGGYRIHHFLDVNTSEAQIVTLSHARAEAGRAGGRRSGASRREANAQAIASPNRSKREANAQAKSKQNEADIDRDIDTVGLRPTGDVPSPTPLRPAPKPSGAAATAHQAIFDALATRFGAPANSAERGRMAQATKLLSEARVPPEEVAVLADALEERWPNAECTPLAIASNVTRLRTPKAVSSNGAGHHGAPSKLAQNAAILRSLLHTEEARG